MMPLHMKSFRRVVAKSCFLLGLTSLADPLAYSAPPKQAATGGQIDTYWARKLEGAYGYDLARNSEFNKFIADTFDAVKLPFDEPTKPSDAIWDYLCGPSEPVEIRYGRYLVAIGWVAHYSHDEGILWIDLDTGDAVLGFIYMNAGKNENSRRVRRTTCLYLLLSAPMRIGELPELARDMLREWYAASHQGETTSEKNLDAPRRVKAVIEIEVASGNSKSVPVDLVLGPPNR